MYAPANVGKAEVEADLPVDVDPPVITAIDCAVVETVSLEVVVFVEAAAAEDSEAATLERLGNSEVSVAAAVVVVAAIIGITNNETAKAADATDLLNRILRIL